ncbi:MAG: hypothetical protein U1A78_31140 [Polyangia bacterium]
MDRRRALGARHGGRWRIEPSDEPAGDQRVPDERVVMPELRARLGAG